LALRIGFVQDCFNAPNPGLQNQKYKKTPEPLKKTEMADQAVQLF
jgi:hypothetical protein